MIDAEVQEAFNAAHPEMADSTEEAETSEEQITEPQLYESAPKVTISPAVQLEQPLTAPPSLDPEWFVSEGVPGVGPKPEFFNDKTFKTLADQAKAQTELRKKLASFTGAPDEGYELNIDPSLGEIGLSDEDPLLNKYAEMFKGMNMSQEGFDQIVNEFIKENISYIEDENERSKTFWETEFAKLGPNAKEDLKLLHQWGEHNLPPELLSDFEEIFDTANKVKIFNLLMDKIVPTQLTHISHGTGLNRQHIQKMMSDPKYLRDMDYRKYVDAEAQQLYAIKKNPIYG